MSRARAEKKYTKFSLNFVLLEWKLSKEKDEEAIEHRKINIMYEVRAIEIDDIVMLKLRKRNAEAVIELSVLNLNFFNIANNNNRETKGSVLLNSSTALRLFPNNINIVSAVKMAEISLNLKIGVAKKSVVSICITICSSYPSRRFIPDSMQTIPAAIKHRVAMIVFLFFSCLNKENMKNIVKYIFKIHAEGIIIFKSNISIMSSFIYNYKN